MTESRAPASVVAANLICSKNGPLFFFLLFFGPAAPSLPFLHLPTESFAREAGLFRLLCGVGLSTICLCVCTYRYVIGVADRLSYQTEAVSSAVACKEETPHESRPWSEGNGQKRSHAALSWPRATHLQRHLSSLLLKPVQLPATFFREAFLKQHPASDVEQHIRS